MFSSLSLSLSLTSFLTSIFFVYLCFLTLCILLFYFIFSHMINFSCNSVENELDNILIKILQEGIFTNHNLILSPCYQLSCCHLVFVNVVVFLCWRGDVLLYGTGLLKEWCWNRIFSMESSDEHHWNFTTFYSVKVWHAHSTCPSTHWGWDSGMLMLYFILGLLVLHSSCWQRLEWSMKTSELIQSHFIYRPFLHISKQ